MFLPVVGVLITEKKWDTEVTAVSEVKIKEKQTPCTFRDYLRKTCGWKAKAVSGQGAVACRGSAVQQVGDVVCLGSASQP